MTSGFVRIHPAALEEAEAATNWYRQRSRRAAEMFLDELDHVVEQIGLHPKLYASHKFGTRRVLLRRFPYLVVFRETDTGMEIVAVAHGHRRPGYWRDRVE